MQSAATYPQSTTVLRCLVDGIDSGQKLVFQFVYQVGSEGPDFSMLCSLSFL